MELKPTLSVRDCAAYLGLSKATIDRLISSSKLRSYKNGRLRKIKREWLLEYEEQLIAESATYPMKGGE